MADNLAPAAANVQNTHIGPNFGHRKGVIQAPRKMTPF
jgi:hypothetical protein